MRTNAVADRALPADTAYERNAGLRDETNAIESYRLVEQRRSSKSFKGRALQVRCNGRPGDQANNP